MYLKGGSLLKKSVNALFTRLLLIFSIIFILSGFIDIFLHFYSGFMVPSWTIGVVSLFSGLGFYLILREQRIK